MDDEKKQTTLDVLLDQAAEMAKMTPMVTDREGAAHCALAAERLARGAAALMTAMNVAKWREDST